MALHQDYISCLIDYVSRLLDDVNVCVLLEPRLEKPYLMFVNNNGADQSAHSRKLVSVSVCLFVAICEINIASLSISSSSLAI